MKTLISLLILWECKDSLCMKYLSSNLVFTHFVYTETCYTFPVLVLNSSKRKLCVFQVIFSCTLSWSSSKSFRVVFRVLTSWKDAIFVVFLLIASRRILKNLTEWATQNVKAQQCHRKSEVVKKLFILVNKQSIHNRTLLPAGCSSTSRIT